MITIICPETVAENSVCVVSGPVVRVKVPDKTPPLTVPVRDPLAGKHGESKVPDTVFPVCMIVTS